MAPEMNEGFFSRWSRRKQEGATWQTAEPAPPAPMPASQVLFPEPVPTPEPASVPVPTLDDVAGLTPESDFQPFMQRGIAPGVRNAAMKKLFTDPHFNVMDGLDVYIDDYTQPDPLPAGMLQRMASAQCLGLVPPEAPQASEAGQALDEVQAPAKKAQTEVGPQVVAQSPDSLVPPSPHDHSDLQLQPDPAPADPQPGSSAR